MKRELRRPHAARRRHKRSRAGRSVKAAILIFSCLRRQGGQAVTTRDGVRMGTRLKLCALIIGCGLAFGCAARQSSTDESLRVERFRHSYEVALEKEQARAGQQVLSKARSAIGTPYVRGGSGPGGFDCSGFVSWAYKSVGVTLPRTAREQSVVGERINKVEEMRAGDIVAFRHPRRGYHTGIYVGEGKFIHSPRRRSSVKISSLDDPYFSKTFLSARRVKLEADENLLAQAESRLTDYAEEKAVRELSVQKKAGKTRRSVTTRRASRSKTVQVAGKERSRRGTAVVSGKAAVSKTGQTKAVAAAKGKKAKVSASRKSTSRKVAAHTAGKSKKSSGSKSRAKRS